MDRPELERKKMALNGGLCQVNDMVIPVSREMTKFPPRCEVAVAKLTKVPCLPVWKLRFQSSNPMFHRRAQLQLITAFIFAVIVLGGSVTVVIYMAVTGNMRFWEVDSTPPAEETEIIQTVKSATQPQVWREEKFDAMWSSWSDWSACGEGLCNSNHTQNRTRECLDRLSGRQLSVTACQQNGSLQVEARNCVCPTVDVRVVERNSQAQNKTAGELITNNSTEKARCHNCKENEICMMHPNSDEPLCTLPKDLQDLSGCGGWCSLDYEICYRVDNEAVRCVEDKECLQGEWNCGDSLCIPNDRRCDGHFNCFDMTDELNCDCKPGEFHCGNETSCLAYWRRCDGYINCWDGSDEADCDTACSGVKYTCRSGQCIPPTYFCDGHYDCDDYSDEPTGCQGTCQQSHFKCHNRRCIQDSFRCNAVNDCGDNSDELNCGRKPAVFNNEDAVT